MSRDSNKPAVLSPVPAPKPSVAGIGRERRSSARYPFTAAADVMELRSQTHVTGRSSDLGFGGCYIDVFTPFPVGAIVRVRLEREQKAFEATATVAYTQVSMGMGLSFTEIEPEHQIVLQTWVAELSGEPAPVSEAPHPGPDQDLYSTVLKLQEDLRELVKLMIRKNVISEAEASALLRQIIR
jgi:hypothetical protein